MSKAAIQITGIKEVARACKEADLALGEKTARGGLKEVHKQVADKVISWARPTQPVGATGDFSGSFKSSKLQKGAQIRSTLIYAGVNEFGGSIPNRGHTGTHLHKPKAPNESYYYYPAIRSHEAEITTTYQKEIDNLLNAIFGRG